MIGVYTFSWIRLARVLQNVINTTKMSPKVLLLHSLPCISISTTLSTKHDHACQQRDSFILHKKIVFFTIKFIYLKSIQSGCKFEPITWNDMWPYVHTFHVFLLLTWIILFFFLYVEIFYLLQIRGGVGIHFKLIPDWIKLTPFRILFLAQYITKFEILPG